ncbi:site-specific DNA-methyltransferase [Commensalibacter melissae]|uniref:site-specific DNA-methyltransferase n=1 Tax=Commensalibacter melissae TaxID=2070537 RepID=UPI0018C21CC5|nr:DNA methyltransferase [Commensalibacter melissae]
MLIKYCKNRTSKTLSPDKSESVDFDKTENLFIEGDNLEALKILQKSYFGKVKMIYIDPPYNTGNDSFIYPDRFKENLENYQKNVGDKDEDGYLIQDSIFKKNRKENGQYHSNWLNMMMPRLYLAKNLLRDDGVIFISIDDNEVHNLRLLMNEIFGEENFVACIVWEKVHTRKNSAKYFSVSHEYILLFAKNKLKWNRVLLPRENIEAYKNPDNHQKGPWKLDPITAHNEYNADYIITKPNGVKLSRPQGSYWRFSENTIKEKIKSNEIVWGDGDSYPMVKRFLSEAQDGLVPITIFHRKFAGDTSYSKKEIDNILTLKGIFEYVKPSLLIKRLMQITIKNNDIILDFFAGSGTTAHAVMQLNAEDGGSRKCISIQLPEICEEKSEAFKAGYKTIADIAKERIRRAGKKIKEDNKDKENIDQLDIGFKVLKVSDSNFREWRTDISSEKLDEQLDLHVDPIAEDASTENMVYELMLKNGKDLNSHIKHHNHIYSISDQENHDENILVLLLEEVNEGVIENVLQENPNKVIALDKLFKNNDQLKTNTALQMQDADIKFETI